MTIDFSRCPGVGAGIAIGKGLIALQKTTSTGDSVLDIIKSVKERAKNGDKDATALVKGFNDISDSSKSLVGVGSMLRDFGVMEKEAPDDLTRQLATLGRELAHAMLDAGIANMEEDRAAAAMEIAKHAAQATQDDIADINGAITKLASKQAMFEDFVRAHMKTVQRIGDTLSDQLFFTLRAREIYLGLDDRDPPPYDLGRIHPDLEMFYANDINRLADGYTRSITSQVHRVISWSTLYKEMTQVSGYNFITTTGHLYFDKASNPLMIQALHKAATLQTAVEFEIEIDESQHLYEARIDGVTITFNGAILKQGMSGARVGLQHTGQCLLRRRPDPSNALGDDKQMVLAPTKAELSCEASSANTVKGGIPPLNRPQDTPPLSIYARPMIGLWRLWLPDLKERWDLSGLQSVEINIIGNALTHASDAPVTFSPEALKFLLKIKEPTFLVVLPIK